MTCNRVTSIAIVGKGVVAWAAAAAFAARLQGVTVTVIEDDAGLPSLADLVGISSPSITDFHHDMRLDERRLMKSTDSIFRLGGRFSGWNGKEAPYFHCHGEHGESIAGAAFHHHFNRLRISPSDLADYSIASVMARSGRLVHPSADHDSLLAQFNYGLHVDPVAYAACLRAYAVALGVSAVRGPGIVNFESDTGRVKSTSLGDGTSLVADLFVDTLGFVANAIDPGRIDWSHWLQASHIEVRRRAQQTDLPLFEDVAAGSNGWRMKASLRGTIVETSVFMEQNSKAAGNASATKRFKQGRRKDAWTKNVVAIGDAAVILEPVEGISLHLAFAHIDRIIASLPDTDFHPAELADFNRQTADEADRLRDFVLLRYLVANRPEDMWRDIKGTTAPGNLSDDLRLFEERGHLPIHDGESFPIDSWLSVLLGQGVRPRRIDPMAAEAALDDIKSRFRSMREAIGNVVRTLPSHRAYLNNYIETV